MNVVDHCTEHSLSDHDFLDISLSRLTCNVERVLDEDCGEGLMAGDGSINSSSGLLGFVGVVRKLKDGYCCIKFVVPPVSEHVHLLYLSLSHKNCFVIVGAQ